MNSHPIETLLDLMRRYGIEEFEYQDEERQVLLSSGERLDLVKETGPEPIVTEKKGETIRAGHIGVFLCAHTLEDRPSNLPRLVRKGEIVGYLKAGGLLRPVTAPNDGVLLRQSADHGTLAGYGTALFLFQPIDTNTR